MKEYLSASFGCLIRNFTRSSGLVLLMDKDVAKMMNATLAENWYDYAHTLAENRSWCQLLGIKREYDLHHIMRDGIPLLAFRTRQLQGITHVPHGLSLSFALFAEAARRDISTLVKVHKALFFLQHKEDFLDMVDEIRAVQRMPPTERRG